MSTIDLNGISYALKDMVSNFDTYDKFSSLNYLPQISMPLLNSDFLSGVIISDRKISKPVDYKDDIFSELPVKIFDETYNKQMASFMLEFKNEFNHQVLHQRSEKVIPKFTYYYDNEEDSDLLRMISRWNDGDSMLYFSFEKDINDSSFGMIWNDDRTKNYQTRSGNINLNKTESIIHEVIEFIFRVYNV